MEKQKSTYLKEKEARHKEYLADMKDKVSFKLNELPDPQPVTYATFDKYNKVYNPKEKKSKKLSELKSDGFRRRRKDTT